MKKGILCILLSLLMITPLLTACNQAVPIVGTEAPIYTLYTIVDESTTNEAITKVELALNRILFYRLGVIVKLEMVTEDQYDELITNKFAEMEAYETEKKNNKNNKNNKSSSSVDASGEVLTGDKILDMLENGEEIPLSAPSLDIFLVRGYDNYEKLVSEKKLSDITEKLENEAKAIKSSIHTTLINATKIDGRTYGIPVNTAIGEYTYFAFDEELLSKYSIDPNTIKTLEDLNDYLATIKENEPDVVPLMNTLEATDINFLVNNGFPALVTSAGEVIDAYSNKKLQEYFALIAQYEALGYLPDESASENTRYAVRLEKGYKEDIDKKLADTGFKYTYSLYSNPVATNENTVSNIFCVSKYVVSNNLTSVMQILTAINTDGNIMDLLTYGVENEHYVFNDDNQIERLNNDYSINPSYIGNRFITTTLEDEDPNKWDAYIQQNIDAIASPSLGYTVDLKEFKYTDEEGNEVTVTEPNYVDIINGVVEKYYPSFMNGTAFEFDYDAISAQATDEVKVNIVDTLNTHYEKNILQPMLEDKVRDTVIAERSEEIRNTAVTNINAEYTKKVKANLKKKLTTEFKAEFPEATDDEIDAMVESKLTDAYVQENISQYYTDEEIKSKTEDVYKALLNQAVTEEAKKIKESPEYTVIHDELFNSEEYKNDLNERLTYDLPSAVNAKVEEKLLALVKEKSDAMVAEIETAIETAVDEFIAEYQDILTLTTDNHEQEILLAIGYLEEKAATDEDTDTDGDTSGETSGETSEESVEVSEEASEGETSEEGETSGEEGEGEDEMVIAEKYASWYQFVLKEKIAASYYALFGEPNA